MCWGKKENPVYPSLHMLQTLGNHAAQLQLCVGVLRLCKHAFSHS